MRKIIYLAATILTALLAGCASIEPPLDYPNYLKKPWKIRKVKLAEEVCWNISGAVSVTSNGKTQMGSFSWKQRQNVYAINFYGPLNLGAFGLKGTPEGVILYKPNGAFSAPNAETIMQQQMGWYLPVSNMFYWVRGLPAPGSKGAESYDDFGHLVLLQQEGWTIQYQAFQNQGEADLPRKIIMDNGALHVKLVIKNWDLNCTP